ncbi:MAG: ATP-binding protein [Sedimentisphaerales bacterium]|nr:ATP-binding protein [Sedimentisphaerales bacterium]
MIFDGKPTRDITVEDLRRLVREHIAEDRYIDYKQEPYVQTHSGTKELVKDVTAFANADGGYIIIGIEEDGENRAAAFRNVENTESVRRSIIDTCFARIEPRLRELDIRAFDTDDASILVVRVPESDQKPHCAKPDAEHHYFWRRYEDGNKLMTTSEIRECFEGDRVERAFGEIQRGLEVVRHEHVISRESGLEIDEDNLFQLESDEAFLRHMEQRFLSAAGERPFYRIWACPLPVNRLDLRDQRGDLLELLRNPPQLRVHGWGLSPITTVRQTSVGLSTEVSDFHHLELLKNGYLEFRTSADDGSFHWG